MKIVLAVALLLFVEAGSAADIIAGFGSYHVDRSARFNEVNPGIGVRGERFSAIYIHENSIEKPSLQLTYDKKIFEIEKIKTTFGVRLGLASGYRRGTAYSGDKIYQGNRFEIGDSGIVPMYAIDIIQPVADDFSLACSATHKLLMFGAILHL